jgi:hypothetical protein
VPVLSTVDGNRRDAHERRAAGRGAHMNEDWHEAGLDARVVASLAETLVDALDVGDARAAQVAMIALRRAVAVRRAAEAA